jgi:hypothetical protein
VLPLGKPGIEFGKFEKGSSTTFWFASGIDVGEIKYPA